MGKTPTKPTTVVKSVGDAEKLLEYYKQRNLALADSPDPQATINEITNNDPPLTTFDEFESRFRSVMSQRFGRDGLSWDSAVDEFEQHRDALEIATNRKIPDPTRVLASVQEKLNGSTDENRDKLLRFRDAIVTYDGVARRTAGAVTRVASDLAQPIESFGAIVESIDRLKSSSENGTPDGSMFAVNGPYAGLANDVVMLRGDEFSENAVEMALATKELRNANSELRNAHDALDEESRDEASEEYSNESDEHTEGRESERTAIIGIISSVVTVLLVACPESLGVTCIIAAVVIVLALIYYLIVSMDSSESVNNRSTSNSPENQNEGPKRDHSPATSPEDFDKDVSDGTETRSLTELLNSIIPDEVEKYVVPSTVGNHIYSVYKSGSSVVFDVLVDGDIRERLKLPFDLSDVAFEDIVLVAASGELRIEKITVTHDEQIASVEIVLSGVGDQQTTLTWRRDGDSSWKVEGR
ncbi:hypothetical protein SH528x_002161 [Novipirellula sp. SH528]|uniref:hypothetical protein n=1 Tax=Novipirellula sp. SH528 TaxID=3454466 RepID=UPI003FA08C5A